MNLIDEIYYIYGNDDAKFWNNNVGYDFYEFMFQIPHEDQNINVNRQIWGKFPDHLDYTNIMQTEYAKGEHFQEYFNCLNNEQQQKVVDCLDELPKRKLAHDSFLWSKGFKQVTLDYMDIYRDNTGGFIEYFSSCNPDEKKTVLKDIMDCDYANKSVEDWLHEHELELVREVSMDG